METHLIVLIVIFTLVILIAIIIAAYGLKRQAITYIIKKILGKATDTPMFAGGSTDDDTIPTRVEDFIDKFSSDRFTPDLALQMESLANDISYDISDIIVKKSNINTLSYAKLLLDTMLHYYIYDKLPNSVSHAAIVNNIKLINSHKNAKISEERIKKLISLVEPNFKVSEEKIDLGKISAREFFRREKILSLATDRSGTSECDNLRDELTKRTVELRTKTEEIERQARKDAITGNVRESSVYSTNDFLLSDCNRERRRLQEQISDLRRDIDRARSSGGDTAELSTLRSRMESLRAVNTQLENQLKNAENSHTNEAHQIHALHTELNNCKNLLDEVLNAQAHG